MVHRVAAESWRGIFLHLDASLTLGCKYAELVHFAGRRRKVATAPTRFAAEAETFRTRSLGERARK